ncbi:MAG: sigma-54-dependent transcriptional regulator [bacterium]
MTVPQAGRILLVDDDKTFRIGIGTLLTEEGFLVSGVESPYAALDRLRAEPFDLVLSDLKMEGMDGIDLLSRVKEIDAELPVLMVTGYASIDTAIEAIRRGAFDYLTKPCNNKELILRVRRGIETRRQAELIRNLREEVEERYSFSNIIGRNRRMREIFKLILQIAETDVTVLIRGETGTGKELVARAIHYASPRKEKPFVPVNCSALTETLLESELFGHERGSFTGAIRQKLGRFEMANGGTLFLDEIGEVPREVQTKLLRVLQEREFERVGGNETIKADIRLIAATNKNLEHAISTGKFREDLFYRLNVIPIFLPPLRDRLDDVPLLANHFVNKCAERLNRKPPELSPAALQDLMTYDWPGNIRELENLLERAVVLDPGEQVTRVDIPSSAGGAGRRAGVTAQGGAPSAADSTIDISLPLPVLAKRALETIEREYMKRILIKYKGSIQRSADHASINRRSFFAKMRAYGLRKEDFKDK